MKRKRILVVDDSEIVLAMAREALEEGGFEVVTVLNAKDGDAHIFVPDRPDLIVMDVMLPVLDGDKKARMLKENELVRDIPILLLSSKPVDEMQRLVRESKSDGFIRKPFTPQQLVTKVRESIGSKLRGSSRVLQDLMIDQVSLRDIGDVVPLVFGFQFFFNGDERYYLRYW